MNLSEAKAEALASVGGQRSEEGEAAGGKEVRTELKDADWAVKTGEEITSLWHAGAAFIGRTRTGLFPCQDKHCCLCKYHLKQLFFFKDVETTESFRGLPLAVVSSCVMIFPTTGYL